MEERTRFSVMLAAGLALLCLAGCMQSADDFVGTWHSEHGGSITTWHFAKNGTFSTQVLRDGVTGRARGVYSVTFGKLSIEGTDVSTSGPDLQSRELTNLLMKPERLRILQMSRAKVTLDAPGGPLQLVRLSDTP